MSKYFPTFIHFISEDGVVTQQEDKDCDWSVQQFDWKTTLKDRKTKNYKAKKGRHDRIESSRTNARITEQSSWRTAPRSLKVAGSKPVRERKR